MKILGVKIKPLGHRAGILQSCILLYCLTAGSAWARADEQPPPDPGPINTDCTDLFPEDTEPAAPADFFSFLDSPQQSISASLENVAQSIDTFFASEKVFYESSGSYIRYSLGTLFEEGGRATTVGNLDLSLRLPRTERKLMLIVESDPVEQQSTLERASSVTSTNATTTDNYYAGLQSVFGKETKWRFKPSIGLKLRTPIEYYVRMRAFRDFDFSKWNLHLTESAYWYDTTGAGFDSVMEWNHLLRDDLLFRSSSLVRNTEQYHRFDLSQVFSITQTLSQRRAITWSVGFFGHSDPRLHATDYLLQMRYRQVVHGNYFFMELVPQIRYRIENAFTQEDSLLLRFEWLFKQ